MFLTLTCYLEWVIIVYAKLTVFSYIMARTSYTMMSALFLTNTLSWMFMVLAHWNKSAGKCVAQLRKAMLMLSQPVFDITPYCCWRNGETTNTNFIVFSMIRLGIEIYHTWGENANHYTTDEVRLLYIYITVMCI